MPPKKAKKAEPTPETPSIKHHDSDGEEDDDEEDQDEAPTPTPTPAKTPKTRTPRKAKKKEPEKIFNKLGSSADTTPSIDVAFENDTVHSKALPLGGYGQMIQLVAPQPFELLTTIMTEDGHQAIVIKPAKPFPFLELPVEVRADIYKLLFEPVNGKGRIEFTSTTGGVIAKDYAKELKHRLAIVQVNKEICAEARPALYKRRLNFDNSTTMLNFLTLTSDVTRRCLTDLGMKVYQRNVATSLMSLLCTCPSLERLYFGSNVGEKALPHKAAKTFFTEVGRLLQALVVNNKGDVEAAFDVLQFGKKCFSIKEGDDVNQWDEDELEQFADAMKEKLNAQHLPTWTCLCGSRIYGHNCHDILNRTPSLTPSTHNTSQATNDQDDGESGISFNNGNDTVTDASLKDEMVRAAEKAVGGVKKGCRGATT